MVLISKYMNERKIEFREMIFVEGINLGVISWFEIEVLSVMIWE